jgi:hypothetical protein
MRSGKEAGLALASALVLCGASACSSGPDNLLRVPEYGSAGGSGNSGGSGGGGATSDNGNNNTSNGGGSGGGSGSGPGLTGEKAEFETNVFPQLSTAPGPGILACTDCHATGVAGAPVFLATTADAAYTAITSGTVQGLLAVPANSLLIQHGQHTGPALTQAAQAIVSQWLNDYVSQHGLQSNPVKTVQGELQVFANCISLTDFTAQDSNANGEAASDIWQRTVQFQGNAFKCQTCHNVGDGGFAADQNASNVLALLQSQPVPYAKKYVTGVVDQQGNFTGLQPSNAISNKVQLAAQCNDQAACHPKFNQTQQLTDTLTAIGDFVNATLQKYSSGQCK